MCCCKITYTTMQIQLVLYISCKQKLHFADSTEGYRKGG
jgi:hypothetical protein